MEVIFGIWMICLKYIQVSISVFERFYKLFSFSLEILKRLDDPTDKVRTTALKNLTRLFHAAPEEFLKPSFKTHHELIIDTLLTHFDDDDTNVQALVLGNLN